MSNTNTGGPAFPTVDYTKPVGSGNHIMTINGGMTLRDYFAAKAMQGLCSGNNTNAKEIAQAAYIVADAMLKAREQ
jgi:hypothetical protein